MLLLKSAAVLFAFSLAPESKIGCGGVYAAKQHQMENDPTAPEDSSGGHGRVNFGRKNGPSANDSDLKKRNVRAAEKVGSIKGTTAGGEETDHGAIRGLKKQGLEEDDKPSSEARKNNDQDHISSAPEDSKSEGNLFHLTSHAAGNKTSEEDSGYGYDLDLKVVASQNNDEIHPMLDESSMALNNVTAMFHGQDHRSLWWRRSTIRGHNKILEDWVIRGKLERNTLKQIYDHNPVFDYCDTCCYPSMQFDKNGDKNPGVGACKWGEGYPNYCRNENFLDNSNTQHKMGRFYNDNSRKIVEVHVYNLYFEMDYGSFCLGGHNHDNEKVFMAYRNGSTTPYKVSLIQHGGKNVQERLWNNVPKHVSTNPKVKYNRDRSVLTREFQWASKSNEKVNNDSPYKKWTMPEIITYELLTDKQKKVAAIAEESNAENWMGRYIYHFGFKFSDGWREIPLSVPNGWEQLKANGMCAGVANDKKTVQLVGCNINALSQQWSYVTSSRYGRSKNIGFLYNRWTKKCLEFGNKRNLYSKAFVWQCNGYDHQLFQKESLNRYKSFRTNYYLGVAYCGEKSSNTRLELKNKYDVDGLCKCTQTWNNEGYCHSWKQLKNFGLCMGVKGNNGSEKKINGARIILEKCESNWNSQKWAIDSSGRLVNRYTGKCLEAGDTDNLYAKAFINSCHSGSHQDWRELNDGRYQNVKYPSRYLGVAYCNERSDDRLIELRPLELGSSQCGCAQTWNKEDCGGDSNCCSWNGSTCGTDPWCNASASNCGRCSGGWLS